MKDHLLYLLLTALLLSLAHAGAASAVEVAPRISDREIVERLTHLESGQQTIRQQMEVRFTAMEKRMDERFADMERRMDERFVAMERRMDERFVFMEKRMDERFVAMDERFVAMEKRMDAQWSLTLVLIVAIFGLIGFVVWDRKTALSPLEKRFAKIAEELERDLETDNPRGSKPTRIVEMLREMASGDLRLADAFERHFSPEGLPGKA
uniref:Uncharacterized protein n=1 Tax=Candidatus Kentrum sp. DK TaxID=2126562 RepID=A0A450TCF0_9GAMM|nr:MAG: hypothetical protein BECKDK2373C_GA0170839_11194 [Candidatus Kentron sp. DK]